ncbi:uncharacterized mitochondrial protein AtMg00810-like [Arachis hypogaea]|uniref:uncharacterized mitochondrial protein AtMg00810-like n=1 Tax=Arachis hypogaea TaxID=3818 RepID=UPI000DEC7A81|nr:uncharacterized protein LOC112803391 [Arachis hypogaea]
MWALHDVSLFTRFTLISSTYILVYVDDILVTGTSEAKIASLVSQLNNTFSLKNLGEMHYCLGIEVRRSPSNTIILYQTKYIKDLLQKAYMSAAKPMPTPMISNLKLSTTGDTIFNNLTLYRSIVGGLQYTTVTRPEITYAVNKVAQFL